MYIYIIHIIGFFFVGITKNEAAIVSTATETRGVNTRHRDLVSKCLDPRCQSATTNGESFPISLDSVAAPSLSNSSPLHVEQCGKANN